MNKKIMKKILTAFLALVILILTSCGTAGLAAPEKPTAELPDSENPNRIVLSWKAVDSADIYYIYRSGTETGSYTEQGFSVTSNEVENSDGLIEVRYSYIDVFDEGDGGIWWYGVKAASNADITNESAMSPVVEGGTYVGTWSDAVEISSSATQFKMTADNSALYAVYSDTGAGVAIAAKKYAEDADSTADAPPMIWTSLTGSPGSTNGTVNNPYSIFLSGGELYTVFRDATAAATNFVSMKYYHDSSTGDIPSFAWEQVGAAKFNTSSIAVVSELTAVTVGFAGDIYSAFLEVAEPKLYKYNTILDTWIERADAELPADVDFVSLFNFNNTLYYCYDDNTVTGLHVRAYDDNEEALQPSGGLVEGSDIDDGNAVIISGGGSLYAVYKVESGSFEVKELIDNIWIPLSNTNGKPTVANGAGYGTLAAHWFNNDLYVFYIDSTDNKGWVKYYTEVDGWQSAEKNGMAITGSGTLSGLQLASSGSILYAGYIEDSKAYVRILE